MQLRTRTIERLRDALLSSGRRQADVLSPAYATLARRGMLSPVERAALTRVEGVAEVLFLVMAADGQITDGEYDAIRGAIRGLSGDALNDGILQVMLEVFALRLKDDGQEARLQAIAGDLTDASEKETAFAMAAAVAIVDGSIAESESSVVGKIADWFGLTEETRSRVLGELALDVSSED